MGTTHTPASRAGVLHCASSTASQFPHQGNNFRAAFLMYVSLKAKERKMREKSTPLVYSTAASARPCGEPEINPGLPRGEWNPPPASLPCRLWEQECRRSEASHSSVGFKTEETWEVNLQKGHAKLLSEF